MNGEVAPSEAKAQSTAFERLVWGVLTFLIGTGVVALVVMSLTVSRLDERVALWTTIYEKRFEGMTLETRDIRQRLERVEGRLPQRQILTP